MSFKRQELEQRSLGHEVRADQQSDAAPYYPMEIVMTSSLSRFRRLLE